MQRTFDIKEFLKAALAEDIGGGDITGSAVIPASAIAEFAFVAREPLVVAGLIYLPELFALVDANVVLTEIAKDGHKVEAGTTLATVKGSARSLLAGERTALNLLQHLSGVATLTRQYVDAVAGTNAKILDTRKTLPGMRALQKYAVTCGGGVNHRMGLYDAVMIKDNHIAVAGGVCAAVRTVRKEIPLPLRERLGDGVGSGEMSENNLHTPSPHPSPARGEGAKRIQVECDTLAQLDEALAAGVDSVLLDNMDLAMLVEGVRRAREKGVWSEASGNVNLQTVRRIAETGVDAISVGKLTHSVTAVDIGLDAL